MEQLHEWRLFFETSGADLMTLIDRAITIASLDKPGDLLRRREGFTEKLFASSLRAASDLSEVEYAGSDGRNSDVLEEKDADKDEGSSDPEMNDIAAYSFADVEALSDEMEEESRQLKEILRIKDLLMDYDQSEEEEIYELLQTLESMNIPFEALRETEIGKQVKNFKKHFSKRVQSAAKRLVRLWKTVVDEWCKSAGDLAVVTLPGNMEENNGEYGLPSPPLDEGALLATRTTSLEMNQLLDFIDDDLSAGSGEANSPGDDRNLHADLNDEFQFQSKDKTLERTLERMDNKVRPTKGSVELDKRKKGGNAIKAESSPSSTLTRKEKETPREAQGSHASSRKESSSLDKVVHGYKISESNGFTTNSSNRISQFVQVRESLTRKPDVLSKEQENALKNGITKKLGCVEEISATEKLAAAKRKLQEGYQKAENAKKQRTVQVMELQDLPKRGPNRAKAPLPAKSNFQNHNRHWSANRM